MHDTAVAFEFLVSEEHTDIVGVPQRLDNGKLFLYVLAEAIRLTA